MLPKAESYITVSRDRRTNGEHDKLGTMAATPQPEPKHHHYVQLAYLEGFVDPDYEKRRESYLWAYMPEKSPFRQKPERIAKRNYYYCFERDNKRRFDVEHALQQLEEMYRCQS